MKSIVGQAVTDPRKAETIFRTLQKNYHQLKIEQLDGGRRISIDEFIDDYTSGERGDLSGHTLRADRLAFGLLGDVIGRSRAIRAITRSDLVKFKTTCLARGLSPNTVKTYLRHIAAGLAWAIKNGYRTRPVEIPKVKTPKLLPKVIPEDELQAILAWAAQHDTPTWRYALFSVSTGCRQEELVRLNWRTVSLYDAPDENGIYGSVVVFGKGEKERNIYLIEDAVRAMGTPKQIGRVFAPWTGSTVSHRFKRAARAAGIENVHFHMLRHTAATRMIEAGLNIRVIQDILGHVDIRTTLRYATVTDETNRREMGKLAKRGRE